MSTKEVWRPILGYEKSHQVSNLGRIRSLDRVISDINTLNGKKFVRNRKIKGRLLKTRKGNNGYMCCDLNSKTFTVHRLVCGAFYGDSKLEVDHKNGDKLDNNLENLEYVTCRENICRAQDRVKKSGLPRYIYKDRGWFKVQGPVGDLKSKHIGNFKNLEDAKKCAQYTFGTWA